MPFSPYIFTPFSQKVLGIFSFFQNHWIWEEKYFFISAIWLFDPGPPLIFCGTRQPDHMRACHSGINKLLTLLWPNKIFFRPAGQFVMLNHTLTKQLWSLKLACSWANASRHEMQNPFTSSSPKKVLSTNIFYNNFISNFCPATTKLLHAFIITSNFYCKSMTFDKSITSHLMSAILFLRCAFCIAYKSSDVSPKSAMQ